ncbi:MAG TPA: CAP domain-containing protein [Candidatus Paceibacterota bacterium]|nr:CAP domain-containing protein [Candidatus Paceibacterota bacterium]
MARLFASLARASAGKLLWVNLALLFALKVALPLGGAGLASITGLISLPDASLVVAETNGVRAAGDLPVLTRNAALDAAAQEKLDDMARLGYFAHVGPTGVQAWDFIAQSGYHYAVAGENLGRGFSDESALVSAWMGSPSHRANIMNAKYRDIGVAVGRITLDGKTATVVVQIFGAPGVVAAAVPAPVAAPVAVAAGTPAPQAVSTERTIAPVTAPVPVMDIAGASAPVQASRFSGAVMGYFIALLGALTMAAGWTGWRRHLKLGLAAHAAVMLALMFVPELSARAQGVIF